MRLYTDDEASRAPLKMLLPVSARYTVIEFVFQGALQAVARHVRKLHFRLPFS